MYVFFSVFLELMQECEGFHNREKKEREKMLIFEESTKIC